MVQAICRYQRHDRQKSGHNKNTCSADCFKVCATYKRFMWQTINSPWLITVFVHRRSHRPQPFPVNVKAKRCHDSGRTLLLSLRNCSFKNTMGIIQYSLNYRVAQTVSHYTESYYSVPIRFDYFVKLQCQTTSTVHVTLYHILSIPRDHLIFTSVIAHEPQSCDKWCQRSLLTQSQYACCKPWIHLINHNFDQRRIQKFWKRGGTIYQLRPHLS